MEKLPTPIEKAKELVDVYIDNTTYCLTNKIAKKCALIAVEEILKEYSVLQIETAFCYKYWLYWNEVKKEIELL